MEALYNWIHNTLGMCFYTLPALVTGLVMIIIGLVHWHNQKKRDDDFQNEMKKRKEEREALQNQSLEAEGAN